MTTKKINKIHKKNKTNKTNKSNKTQKTNNASKTNTSILVEAEKGLTPEQKAIICKTSANTQDTFEDKIEELFKKNGMDVVSTSYNLENKIISDLKQAVNPKNVQPNDDYYSYINDRWITDFDKTEGQEYLVQLDDFRITQDKVYRELAALSEDYISNPATKNTKLAKLVKTAYTSFKGWNTNEQLRNSSKGFVKYIDELLEDKESIWQKLAYLNKNEITAWGAPFVWSINPDDKDPTKYRCYLEPPQLTLIDIDVYFDDDSDTEEVQKYKKNYRRRYLQYIEKVFVHCLGKNHNFNVKDVFDTEVELLNAMACDLIKDTDADGYNLVTKDEALKQFGFNWEEFCKGLGFKKVPDDFVTSNINYLLCGTKLLLEKWNSPQWRPYWIYLHLRQQSRWNKEGLQIYFDFQGRFVRGQEGLVDDTVRPILYGMGFCFNTLLTNEYIKKYRNEQAVNYVKTMAEDLKTVFIRIIKRNNWMEPKTKKKALEKLTQLKLIVGSPDILREVPMLDYTDDDPWGNVRMMTMLRHEKAIQLVGKPIEDIPVIDWSQIPPKFVGTQAYVVNASYTPTQNAIYIPLGYIQKPFVDLDERGLEYNLSRIGFTIAHEMSHALDDWGSKYDEIGRLNDWWTEKDKKVFKKIQMEVIKQYEAFAKQDGVTFDAEPTIGEDLADISGLAICQEYLRDFQLKNQDILPIQALSFRAFYVFFAVQSRQKISKKAMAAQLKTNPHPLDKYRCNVPLSRSKVFRTIYEVKKGDKMWWPKINTVWSN
ncbi:MAG: M13 family metallopeptidase [Candidatus Marinimicrobia bacterium]|nr:M13 family metallopeptidase [Candidatus Neomarinimicrobiota bacterium]